MLPSPPPVPPPRSRPTGKGETSLSWSGLSCAKAMTLRWGLPRFGSVCVQKGEHDPGFALRPLLCLLCGGLRESGCDLAGGGRSTRWRQWGWLGAPSVAKPPCSPLGFLASGWRDRAGAAGASATAGTLLCGAVGHICTTGGIPWDGPGCHPLGWTAGGGDKQGTASAVPPLAWPSPGTGLISLQSSSWGLRTARSSIRFSCRAQDRAWGPRCLKQLGQAHAGMVQL